jgi:hypothetical protein
MTTDQERQTKLFLAWWQDDKERSLCTLEQAIGAYISTFPGRLHSLLVELLQPFTQ